MDTSEYVIDVWRYLQQATPADVLSLPDVPSKISIKDAEGLTQAEKWLIGFHLCRGKAKPRHTGHGQNSWAQDKIRISKELHKIRHWSIIQGSYEDMSWRPKATYFIDPPYKLTQERKGNSDRYPGDPIDYTRLAHWCETRSGQVIVCEGEGADWLPFELLTTATTNTNNRATKKAGEYMYHQIT